MTYSLNGSDFSKCIHRYGLSVQYEKIYGSGGGFMRDGTETVDLRRVRHVIVAVCNPLTSEKLSALSLVCRERYIYAEFFDPEAGRVIRIEAEPTLAPVNTSLVINGVTHWTGATITLKER